jgi:hypothetical protein
VTNTDAAAKSVAGDAINAKNEDDQKSIAASQAAAAAQQATRSIFSLKSKQAAARDRFG